MSKISFIGDPHVANFSRFGGPKVGGLNERGRLSFECLRDALRMSREAGCTLAVILGDLVDSMRPEPQLLAGLRALFREMNAAGLEIILLKGNHDSASDAKGDCALYALMEKKTGPVDVPRVVVHDGLPLALVPFRSGPVAEWLPGALETLAPPPGSVLCMHAGIKDKETAPWLQSAPDAIEREVLTAIMDQYELSLCFAGNWHDHKVWADYDIHQVGALCPTGFSNLGIKPYGHVAVLETRGEEDPKYFVVPGPRFLKITGEGDPRALPDEGHTYFIEWHVPADRFDSAKRDLEQLIADKKIFAGSVLPEAEDDNRTEAGFAAELAVGIDEAISAYVGALSIPQHLRRESVEARVRSFLGGTG